MSGDHKQLRDLGQAFARNQNYSAALLCLDHFFKTIPRFQSSDCHQVADILAIFTTYVSFLRDTAHNPDPCHDVSIRRLFGFRLENENEFFLPSNTFLNHRLMEHRMPIIRLVGEGAMVSGHILGRLLLNCLSDRLRDVILREDSICHTTKAFTPCLSYIASGNCYRVECPQIHVDVTSLQPSWYNMRVRIHLQQILIFQALHRVYLDPSQRFWRQL
jgi:hypothetical protein